MGWKLTTEQKIRFDRLVEAGMITEQDYNNFLDRYSLPDDEEDGLFTEMTVGGRTYEFLKFIRKDEVGVHGDTIINRSRGMGANYGEEDCRHILFHQEDIPVELRRRIPPLIFTEWTHPNKHRYFAVVICKGSRLVQFWEYYKTGGWKDKFSVPRRKFE